MVVILRNLLASDDAANAATAWKVLRSEAAINRIGLHRLMSEV
jgi:hypothetical protein